MRSIVLDPYIPLALWVPLALAAAALWGWYAAASRGRLTGRRRVEVLALMATAIAIPLAILLNPTWLEQVPPLPGKPLLTVLVDRSASMATEDAPQHQSRYQAACRFAADLDRLSDRYEVRLRSFAGDCSATTVEALKSSAPMAWPPTWPRRSTSRWTRSGLRGRRSCWQATGAITLAAARSGSARASPAPTLWPRRSTLAPSAAQARSATWKSA